MISKKAIEMIKHHEGVRLLPYRCPARLWTVGVGHVIDPNHAKVPFDQRLDLSIPIGWNRKLTMDEVDAILAKDLERFEIGVVRLCPGSVDKQNHLDAMVSFAFNVGLGNLQKSTLRMKYNRGDYDGASEAFLDWTKAAGKILPGLVKRRKDEQALFLGQ
jgi:lysozyme